MSDNISNVWMDIGRGIEVTRDNNALTASMILTYCAINTMAYLSMDEDQNSVSGADFIKWVEEYLKTDSSQSCQYRGIDVWGARCAMVHRYGSTSDLSDGGGCKVFGYHNGSEHMYDQSVDANYVSISMTRFIDDFCRAMKKYLRAIMNDDELKTKVRTRIDTLLHTYNV